NDLTVYAVEEFAGIKAEDLVIPDEFKNIAGEKAENKLAELDRNYLEKLRQSGVDVEKSEEKVFIKKKKEGIETYYQKDNSTYSLNSDLKNRLALTYTDKNEDPAAAANSYAAEGNRGNIESLADSTPENINKF